MTVDDAIRAVTAARSAQDVLGPDDAGRAARYRQFALLLHPDNHPGNVRVSDAMAKLTSLVAAEKIKAKVGFDVVTKLRTYSVGDRVFRSRVANLYDCTYVRDGDTKAGLLKLPRTPKDNDLLQTEGKHLKMLGATGSRRTSYLPRLEESFKHRDTKSGMDRWANVLRRLDGFIALSQVRPQFYDGIDPRDVAWMWRRSLAAISLAHEQGIVHTSLVPEHILIRPADHGLILVGWANSVADGEKAKTLGGPAFLYAPEVTGREPVGPGTDIYMLSRTMEYLMGSANIAPLRAFVQGCTQLTLKGRPTKAREILGEYDELIERLWGPRQFRPFTVPVVPQAS